MDYLIFQFHAYIADPNLKHLKNLILRLTGLRAANRFAS